MEFQPEVNNVEHMALNNPIILTEIFKQAATPLKTCRLVSQFWNKMVLSLPNTRLALDLKHKEERCKMSFFELCSSLVDARLVKRISCLANSTVDSFASKLLQVCDKFGDTVQILELDIAREVYLSSVYQVLKNSCPNLKQLRISCTRSPNSASSTDLIPAGEIMSIKQNLIFFKVVKASSKRVTSHLTNFIDVVINASPNLKEVTLPWGFSPDLSNSKYLDSLTIALDNVDPCDIVRAEDKLSNMSRMLSQVRNQLVKLSFDYVDNTYVGYGSTELDDTKNFKKTHFHLPTKKMPKLKTFRNRMTDVFRCDDLLQNIVPNLKSLMIGKAFQKSKSVDDIVQNICLSKKKVLPNMTNLRVMQLHDPKLLKRLVTVFPNLEKLKLDTFDTRDSGGKKTLLKLGVVLKTCRGWRVLKHLGLRLPKYPKQVEDVIQALLKAKKLFKQLKTLSLGTCKFDNKIHDLSANEIDLFKQLLVAIRGMDRVGIAGIYYGKESAESIRAFMALNEMRVSKFSVVEEESEETDADSVNYDGDYNWSMDGDSSVDFEFSDDWHESYDDWCESYDDDSD